MCSLLGALVSAKLWLQPALQPFSFRLNPWVPSLAQPLLLPSNSRQAVISSCLPAIETKWKGSPFSGSPPITSFSVSNFFPVYYLTVLQWITLHSFPGSMASLLKSYCILPFLLLLSLSYGHLHHRLFPSPSFFLSIICFILSLAFLIPSGWRTLPFSVLLGVFIYT